jgi:DNA polymerase-2
VHKPGATQTADFQPLLEEVAARTGLSISLDGIYRWVVFLPSRVDGRAPVPNRYFGVFQDGSLKVRGIEARRRDTPRFVVEVQMELLEILAKAPSLDEVPDCLPKACQHLRRRLAELRAGRVPPEKLLMGLKLSRKLEAYTSPSAAARAVAQLNAVGKSAEPGQRIRFLWLRGANEVHAWDLPHPPDPARLDLDRYAELLLRAAEAVLVPFGVTRERMLGYAAALPLFGRRALPERWYPSTPPVMSSPVLAASPVDYLAAEKLSSLPGVVETGMPVLN